MTLDFTNLSVEQLKRLNDVSVDIHEDFNKLTEEILNSTPKKIADLVGNILSRHPYQSGLFKICYTLEFIHQYRSNIKKIYTDDYQIYKGLKEIISDYKIIFKGNIPLKKRIIYFLKPYLTFVLNLKTFKQQYFSRSFQRKKQIKKLSSIILIDTFLLQNSIDNKRYIDRYYNGILDYVNNSLKKRIYFLPHIIGKYSKKDVDLISKQSTENILFKNDFLKFTDYFIPFFSLLNHKVKKDKKFYFRGYNLTNFIHKSIRKERYNTSSYQGLLNYFFVKRLKEEKITIDLFIDWNENQPIDKGFIKGIHDYYPGVKVKGYRGFIISMDYNLYLMPTKYEVENKVIPDEIVLISESLIGEVKKFYKNIKVLAGPAFRYMELYDNATRVQEDEKYILVALPIGFEDSVEIIKTLSESQKDIDIKNLNFIIKPHPTTLLNRLKEATKAYWKINYHLVGGSFKENILRSTLFISNTSSAIMEALAYGVPVIIVGSGTTITQNPIPATIDKKIWKIIFTGEELAKAISHYMSLTKKDAKEFIKMGDGIKRKYFELVTKESVENFLKF